MSFIKTVLLLVFAVLLISAEVSALRDLAETKTAPTTHGSEGFGRVVVGGRTGNRGPVSRSRPENCNNYYNRNCHRYENGGKGGTGERGGRGAPGPETGN